MLNEDRILPTNAMRACTASIVELSYNGGGVRLILVFVSLRAILWANRVFRPGLFVDCSQNAYRAEVEMMTVEEWETEVETLIDDLYDEDGRSLLHGINRPGPNSVAGIALAKMDAVVRSCSPSRTLLCVTLTVGGGRSDGEL